MNEEDTSPTVLSFDPSSCDQVALSLLNQQDDLMISVFEFFFGSEILIQIRLVCKEWYQLSTKVPLYFHSSPPDYDLDTLALCEHLTHQNEFTNIASIICCSHHWGK